MGCLPLAQSPPLARAARFQGCFPIFDAGGQEIPGLPEPELVAAIREDLLGRGASPAIDIVCRGDSGLVPAGELASRLAELEQAGMTWWLESFAPGQSPQQIEPRDSSWPFTLSAELGTGPMR